MKRSSVIANRLSFYFIGDDNGEILFAICAVAKVDKNFTIYYGTELSGGTLKNYAKQTKFHNSTNNKY